MTKKKTKETLEITGKVKDGEIKPPKVDKPSNCQNEIVEEAIRKAKELLKNNDRMS
ncbi:hypothetical protein N752_12905 [Desulforamulus aquiferis]|nr:hypothetical protein [Desulforamulus aquiferis]RYD04819.1 hypothetical protein N752_12905 [Desulforamulus aquiferis]